MILGDLTVAKNNHPARVVNRLVDGLIKLSQHYKHIYILKGNHDYSDPNCPFFGFLQHTKENITFIQEPTKIELSIGEWVFVPAGTDWSTITDLITAEKGPYAVATHVFAHATFDGAISETGYQLTGVNPQIIIDANAHVISGDIHKQQKIAGGRIEYVGAPYHIHFGDQYMPRLLLLTEDFMVSPKRPSYTVNDLRYPAPRKFTQIIQSMAELYRIKIQEGDQIKIIAQMRRADLPEWKSWREAIKEQADKEGWVLHGPELRLQQDERATTNPGENPSENIRQSPEQLVKQYAVRQKASEAHISLGNRLLRDTRK